MLDINIQRPDAKIKASGIKSIHINGVLRGNNFELQNSYLINTSYEPSLNSGDYLVELKDKNKNNIFSTYTNIQRFSEGNIQALNFNLNLQPNALFVDISKFIGGQKTLVRSIVIPSDILTEEIKYIKEQLIIGSVGKFKKDLAEKIEKYKKAIMCRSYGEAKSIVSSDILKLIDSGLDVSRKRISNIEIDKSALNSKALDSLSHLNKATSGNSGLINPFLGLCLGDEILQGQQSRLEISLLKKPLNTEYEYIARSWFDDVEAEVKDAKVLEQLPLEDDVLKTIELEAEQANSTLSEDEESVEEE